MNKPERHAQICAKLNDTYARKNHDYGDSFTQLRQRQPNAILVRLFDKYLRLETLLSGATQQVKDESIDDTLVDLANYCIMELVERQIEREDKPEAGNPVTDKPVENNPFDWDAFKTKKIAVHCDTEDKAKAFMAECKRRFPSECRRWENDEVNLGEYKSETTYSIVCGDLLFADVEYDRKDGYTIVDYPFNQRKEDRT